jgi:peptide/nickel transport system substrate-binding protein
MSSKKYFALLIVIALLLSSCTPAATQTTVTEAPSTAAAEAPTSIPAPAVGGTLRVGWGGSPDTLNPGTAILSESYILFDLVYDSLFQLNLDGSYSPELADSYEVSDDGLVWTFHIHQGVKWHDGEDLTAKDVAFSINFYKANEDFPYLNVYTEYFDTIEATDDYTVVINMSEAIPNMESQLIFLYVIPEHIWSAHQADATEFENTEMIGSGPFKMVEYKQNEFVHLAAVKDHFLYPPKIDEIVFQTFENQDALVQAIRAGQVDMITEMPLTAVATLRNDPNIKVVTGPPLAPDIADIILNQITEETCPPEDGVCSGHPALRDHNVRLALAHATDKKKIIDVVLLGLGNPGLTLIADSLGPWYDNKIQDYAYDIDQANQILDDAGYLDKDGDGTRDMPDGSHSLTFRINWPNDSANYPRVAELLGEMWAQIGVKLVPQALDPDALTSVCCPAFDYDVIIWGWGSDPDPGFLLSVMTTDEIPTGNSETGYSNPEYDQLYKDQATELDLTKRLEIVWKMQEIVHQDVTYIIPYYALEVQAYRVDRFKGWIINMPKLALFDPSSLTVIEPVQ